MGNDGYIKLSLHKLQNYSSVIGVIPVIVVITVIGVIL